MPLKGEYAFSVGNVTADSQSASVLTLTGAPGTASGKNGGGIDTNEAKYADSPGVASASGQVTVMGWYKLSATTAFAKALVKNSNWSVYISCFSGVPRLLIQDQGHTASTLSVALPNDTNWHHWAVTFGTGANIPLVMYVDGVQVNNDTFFGSTAINLTSTFRIGGADPDGLGGTGTITQDDVRVFNEILVAGTVTTWMNTAGPTAGPATVNGALLSNVDLEMRYLASLGATGPSLLDRRFQIYGANQHAYFAARSGLTPAAAYSLSDHMYAYYKGAATAWTEKRRNLATWSRGTVAPGEYDLVGSQTITAGVAVADHPNGIATAARVSYLANATNAGISLANSTVIPALVQATMSAWIKPEVDDVATRYGFALKGQTSEVSRDLTVGSWTRISWTITADALARIPGFRVPTGSAPANGSFLATGLLVELAPTQGSYFDGSSTPGNALEQYRWLGTPDASQSVFETRLSNVASDGSLADVQRRFWRLTLGV